MCAFPEREGMPKTCAYVHPVRGVNILGEPMTAEDMTVDLDTQDDFTFRFDVALAPELNVKVDKKIKVPYYTITVDDDMVKRQNESFLSRFG